MRFLLELHQLGNVIVVHCFISFCAFQPTEYDQLKEKNEQTPFQNLEERKKMNKRHLNFFENHKIVSFTSETSPNMFFRLVSQKYDVFTHFAYFFG